MHPLDRFFINRLKRCSKAFMPLDQPVENPFKFFFFHVSFQDKHAGHVVAHAVLIHLLDQYIDVEEWIKSNSYIILLIAVLIGIIPESGPHIVFISLFASGSIPVSILLANSIVQDGHGAIPLLAESRRSFIWMKLINALVGLIIGSALLLTGF